MRHQRLHSHPPSWNPPSQPSAPHPAPQNPRPPLQIPSAPGSPKPRPEGASTCGSPRPTRPLRPIRPSLTEPRLSSARSATVPTFRPPRPGDRTWMPAPPSLLSISDTATADWLQRLPITASSLQPSPPPPVSPLPFSPQPRGRGAGKTHLLVPEPPGKERRGQSVPGLAALPASLALEPRARSRSALYGRGGLCRLGLGESRRSRGLSVSGCQAAQCQCPD